MLRPSIVLATLAVPPLAQQDTLLHLSGDVEADLFGASVAGAGDVDQDGCADLLIGVPGADPNGRDSGTVELRSGETGQPLWVAPGLAAGDTLGTSVDAAGDFNNDGTLDVVVGGWGANTTGTDAGLARVLSGADGSELGSWLGAVAGDNFGSSVAGVGDYDQDGFTDVAVGAPGVNGGAGRLFVFSGQTGATLAAIDGEAALDGLGWSVAGVGDYDSNGFDDLVVSAIGNDEGGMSAGKVYLVDGNTGASARTWLGEAAFDLFGWDVDGVGDADHDGTLDVVAGAPFSQSSAVDGGRARVLSGMDGSLIASADGLNDGEWCGFAVSGIGDVNGDLDADFVVGSPFNTSVLVQDGAARVFSSADGSLLAEFVGPTNSSAFASALDGAGDVNGDGILDLVVGAENGEFGAFRPGTVSVRSTEPVPFGQDVCELSLSAGGVAIWTLDAPTANAGDAYLVVGSVSGTKPGTDVGGVHVPLNADAWTNFTILKPNTPLLLATFSLLDAEGDATAGLNLAMGSPPELAGITLHHAFVVFGGGGVEFASNAVPLTLID